LATGVVGKSVPARVRVPSDLCASMSSCIYIWSTTLNKRYHGLLCRLQVNSSILLCADFALTSLAAVATVTTHTCAPRSQEEEEGGGEGLCVFIAESIDPNKRCCRVLQLPNKTIQTTLLQRLPLATSKFVSRISSRCRQSAQRYSARTLPPTSFKWRRIPLLIPIF
jgi:hypothetical protein